ncbi:MAG TPA: tetratricopeptide repeat protein, partial [Planctomycetaceae bacterium]|nr:tetratricopeptide repeat protein [Planctomycetaceae bacterium]
MSRSFVIALSAVVAVLALGGTVGAWIFLMDRDPPHKQQTAGATPAKIKVPVGDTIYLTVNESKVAPTRALPLTLRELVRQAFLVAARDELGLSTRDVMLREDFPKHPEERFIPFDLSAQLAGAGGAIYIDYTLVRQSTEDEELWRSTVRTDTADPNSIVIVAEKAEAMSRGELKEALTRAGGKGSVPAARSSSEVPSATSDLIWTWNEISVMAGLRKVHAEIREKGESPQLLAALAVGYANLGSLTEYYYGAQCKVYYSRALLYAERLLRKTDQSPWALWHRAYVRLLFGLHGAGGDDIAAAKKKPGSATVAQPLPFWTDVVNVYAQGRFPQLLKVAKTPAQRRLARYLILQSVIYGNLHDLRIKSMKDFLAEVPDCPLGFDLLAASGQIGTEREGSDLGLVLTGILIRKRLPDVPGLPASITERVRDKNATIGSEEIDFRKTVISSLEQVGTPQLDRGEPSLSAVGHSIEEMSFAQVIRKLEVDRNALGIPVDDTIAGLGPLVAGHPFGAYVGAFAQHKEVVEGAAAALVSKLAVHEISLKSLTLVQWLASTTRKPEHAQLWRVAGGHADLVISDQMRTIQAQIYGDADAMKHLGKISSALPVVVAAQIWRNWSQSAPQADKYEREYSDDPLVMDALSNRYFQLKRYDDAERCAKLAPGYSSYRALAAVYKAKKDPGRWRETLDRAIKLPSYGLEQAQVQDEIAHDLLEQKKWKEAVVYGDAAAESYSGWSLMTAARCHEMLGEWEKAEQLVKAVSERYDDHILNWMCWCHRTGHGDVRSADEFAHSRIQAWGSRLFGQQLRQI